MDQQILKAIQWTFLLLLANTCLLSFGVCVALVILFAGFNARGTLLDILGTIKDMLRQVNLYLQMGKQYSESIRIHQSQMAEAMKDVKEAAQATPHIAQSLEKVPEVTAEKVVGKLKSGDSNVF